MYRVWTGLLLGLLSVTSGCAFCSSCDDDTYAAFGGRWQRDDMSYGRVGSAFTAVGSEVTGVAPPEPQHLEVEGGAEAAPGVESYETSVLE